MKETDNLLSKSELSFFKTLAVVLKDNHVAFAKVRQADILQTQTSWDFLWNLYNKISPRRVDFVICEKHTSKILFVVELNEETAKGAKSEMGQAFKKALAATSIKLLEISAKYSDQPNELKALIYGKSAPVAAERAGELKQTHKDTKHLPLKPEFSMLIRNHLQCSNLREAKYAPQTRVKLGSKSRLKLAVQFIADHHRRHTEPHGYQSRYC